MTSRDYRAAHIALADGAPGHFQHPFERDPGTLHDLGRQFDPGFQIAKRDVKFFERVERHVRTHVAVAVAVAAGHADFGVVPVENSGTGTIQSTLDLFLTSPLMICGEVELRVHQYLLSRTGHIEDIERVYSHALSLAQCKNWLRQNLPKVEKHAVVSNAEAARRARNAPEAAALAINNPADIEAFLKSL